jgi:hypothetical protein
MHVNHALKIMSAPVVALGLASASHAAIVPYTPDADTAFLYSLDNPTGDISTGAYVDDDSSNGLDMRSDSSAASASPFNGVAGPNGLGTAATFDASAARVFRFGANDISPNVAFDQFTVEAWVRNPGSGNATIVYMQDQGQAQRFFFRLTTNANGTAVQLVYDEANSTSSTTLGSSTRVNFVQDQWYHVALTYDDRGSTTADDSVVNFYLTPETATDRVLVGTSTNVADIQPLSGSGETLELGQVVGGLELGGDLDEVRWSNTVRSEFNLIPEPSSMALITLGGVFLLRRHGRG